MTEIAYTLHISGQRKTYYDQHLKKKQCLVITIMCYEVLKVFV